MKPHTLAALVLLATAPAAKAGETVAKIATVAPDGTPWAEQLRAYKNKVEKGSEGRIKVKPYLGGALGDENVTASETKRGAIQIWGGSTGALATMVPELALFELPYLFRSEKEADYVIDEVLFEDMKKVLAARGFTVLFWAENGYRSFGTAFGPVKTPEAMKGKKMRSQESEVHIEMYRALGASPVPIAVTEVLSSLQTKVVDGFDNTPLFTFAASWHQGIKHYSLTEAIYQPGIVVANKAWFDSLSPEDQKLLSADAKQEAATGRAGVRELAPLLIENFKNAGIAVHTLTPEDKAAFAKLTEPGHDKWIQGKGKSAAPMLKRAKAALAEYRKRNP
ncbi:MAG: TRAP transporter substrate-binding protein [Myxococcales bacterium]|nr:TRAP transporter substrate-binding protein [Myxococcales bacterium]